MSKDRFKIILLVYEALSVIRTEYIWFTFGLPLKTHLLDEIIVDFTVQSDVRLLK